jgi:glycosyltransferase involved in cell wall biosynthesis
MPDVRVLHCIPSMEGGGAERQLAYLAEGLKVLGWDVHVALLRNGTNLARLEGSGATVHHIGVRGNHDPSLVPRIASLIGRIDASLVQTWLLQMDVGAALAALMTRTPFVVTERSCEAAYPPGVKTKLRRLVARQARAIVSNSPGGNRYWESIAGGPQRLVIPNGLPLGEIDAAVRADLSRYGIAPSDRVVLYAGRFSAEKNLDTLYAALAGVVSTEGVKAVLCGDGPLREHTDAAIRRANLEGRVFTPGYVNNVWEWMKRAQVFVSVGMFEGHPNTVLEALACGCRIVASDIEAHRDFLDEEVAELVDPGSPSAIQDAIVRSLTSPEPARAQARARAGRWSMPAVAAQYDLLYRQILDGSGARRLRVPA